MNPKPFFTKLFFLLSLFYFLESCKAPVPGIWRDEKIEADKRADLHVLNNQLIEGLKQNKPKDLEFLLSKEMIEDNSRLRLIELCSNRLKEGTYSLLGEYYIVNETRGQKALDVKNEGINNRTLSYNAETQEMYIAFFIPKSIPNQYMITAIYCKYSYGWKVSKLEVEPYTQNGRTAPELYKAAKEMYAKKYLLDAVNTMALSNVCAKPFDGWQYTEDAEMGNFYAQIIAEINKKYLYPFTMTNVPTQPRIFSITTRTTPEGVFPMVYYMTKVKLQDIVALRKENENIKKVIGKNFPGIDKDKKYVFYDAYNEWPKFDRSVDRYEMLDKLK